MPIGHLLPRSGVKMKSMSDKEQMIYWAQLLNQKSLVTARSGNISLKREDTNILMTCHDSYLGQLESEELVAVDALSGELVEGERKPTSEKDLHLSIYQAFDDVQAVVHAHSPNTVAFFDCYDSLFCTSFEAELYLGEVPVVEQNCPTVMDIEPVIDALRKNKIVVLGRHGVVAIGKNLKEAFSLVEVLEEQTKVNIAMGSDALFADQYKQDIQQYVFDEHEMCGEKHIKALLGLIDKDEEFEETAAKQNITLSLALADTIGQAIAFHFENGELVKVDESVETDCVLKMAPEYLRYVCSGEMNAFVAMVQGRATLEGDFAQLSLYYETLQCLFEFFKCFEFASDN